jgi:elongation factor Ts
MMEKIKQLREKTGAGVMDAKKALEQANGDLTKAEEIIRAQGLSKAEKKSEREASAGLVYSYIHQGGKVGVMVEMNCETDFVAKNEDFVNLCKEICLQITSMKPENVEELLKQDYIRDGSQTIEGLIKALIGKTGENMKLRRFVRYELGE